MIRLHLNSEEIIETNFTIDDINKNISDKISGFIEIYGNMYDKYGNLIVKQTTLYVDKYAIDVIEIKN